MTKDLTGRRADDAVRSVGPWTIGGGLAVTILGVTLHYVYPLSGGSPVVGLLAPVNESVWEHLKLGYTALILFSAFEYPRLRERVNNYFAARLLGVIALELTVLAIFYGYTLMTRRHVVWVDIMSYVAGVAVCQGMAWRLLRRKPLWAGSGVLAAVLLIALGVIFAVFTFHPPHTGLFMDHNTYTYGIPRK